MSSPTFTLQLLHLPDDVILSIFSYLNPLELWNSSQACKRLRSISLDRALVRDSSFEGIYSVRNEDFSGFVRAANSNIEKLNCDYCYWLNCPALSSIERCKNLNSLSVIDCQLTPKRICQIVAKLSHLEKLAFSVLSIREFCTEYKQFPETKSRFGQLKELVIHFKRAQKNHQKYTISINVVQETIFLEDCENLEKLSIVGGPNCFPKDLLRPLLNKSSMRNLKEIGINEGADPAARLFYFGVLIILWNLDLSYKTMLMPSANFAHLKEKPGFENCLKYSTNLQHLDVSRAETNFSFLQSTISPLSPTSSLRHLNIADNYNLDSNELKLIASCCPQLTSLNLQNCAHVFMNAGLIDTTGMENLLEKCSHLNRLNLSGIHVHSIDGPEPIQTLCHMLTALKELKSLALPACCLCTPETEEDIPTQLVGKKRVRVSYSAPLRFGKRKRVGVPIASTSSAPECDAEEYEGEGMKGELDKLTTASPNMEHFELIGAGFRSVFNNTLPINFSRHSYTPCAESHTVSDDELKAISKWKNLTSLQISGLPGLLHGKSLLHIGHGCRKLERLYLSFLGSGAHWAFQPALSQALKEMNKLKDFRLEQHNVSLNSFFFESFYNCVHLERLCVISRNGTLYPEHLQPLMERMPRLVALQLFTGATLTSCKKAQSILLSRFSDRPALSVTILPASLDELPNLIRSIPTKHYDNLLLMNSDVAARPEGW